MAKVNVYSLKGDITEECTVTLDDNIITGPGADRGMVFQSYMLFDWKTVRENVELGPKFRGIPEAERRAIAQRNIEMVGLKGFENYYLLFLCHRYFHSTLHQSK